MNQLTLQSTEPRPTSASEPAPARDNSIDWLRGLVMVVMVLDHARDFFFGLRPSPTDLATTTPVLFATRIVTHVCAPTFVFLAGTAAFLYGRKRSPRERSLFLLTRGLWLVLLEVMVIRLGWIPDLGYHFTLLQVIWAIGWSMLVLAALSRLPLIAVATFGAAMVLGHNLFDRVQASSWGDFAWLWHVLHQPGPVTIAPGHIVMVAYPLVPWIGVMALGFAFGAAFALPAAERRGLCLRLGVGLVLAFAVIRGLDGYGDPKPWGQMSSALWTAMSFVNVTKYPPSLAYLCMTLGPALIALSLAPARADGFWARPLVVFGRVPLFFYVAHLFLLRYSSAPLGFVRFGAKAFLPPPQGTGGSPELGLGMAYLAWLVTLLVLYPACVWYGRVKASRAHPLLAYL